MDTAAPAPPLVLNAVEFNEARFDQPPSPLLAKIFICTSQRTGSFLLGRALLHHGLGVSHEYWNPGHTSALSARWGVEPSRYIDTVLARRTVCGIFAAKVQWWQYARFLDNPAGDSLLQGGNFVYLYREDLLDQAISLHLSMETGRWGLDSRAAGAPAEPRFFDHNLIESRLVDMADADRNWRLFFAHHGIEPVFVSYEALTKDPDAIARRIMKAFELPPSPRESYREARVRRPSSDAPSAGEIRASYLQARRRVAPRGRMG